MGMGQALSVFVLALFPVLSFCFWYMALTVANYILVPATVHSLPDAMSS